MAPMNLEVRGGALHARVQRAIAQLPVLQRFSYVQSLRFSHVLQVCRSAVQRNAMQHCSASAQRNASTSHCIADMSVNGSERFSEVL